MPRTSESMKLSPRALIFHGPSLTHQNRKASSDHDEHEDNKSRRDQCVGVKFEQKMSRVRGDQNLPREPCRHLAWHAGWYAAIGLVEALPAGSLVLEVGFV